MATVRCTACEAELPATDEPNVVCPSCGHHIDIVRAAHTSHTRDAGGDAGRNASFATGRDADRSSAGERPLPGFQQHVTRQDGLVIAGYIFAGLGALTFIPLIAVVSIVLGAIARGRGDERGRFVMLAGTVALLIGLAAATWYFTRTA